MKVKSYNELTRWHEIMNMMPEHNRIQKGEEPKEVIWDWRGNKIHVDYYLNKDAKAKVITLHGIGGNGRLLSFIGAPLFRQGYEVISPDLPGFGISEIPGKRIPYQMWIDLVDDLINLELEKDDRPIFLFGLSAGGMTAYSVGAQNKKMKGMIFTNLLDQREKEVLYSSVKSKLVAKIGIPMLKFMTKIMPKYQLPMKQVADSEKLINDETILKMLLTDKHSAGTKVPVELISTISAYTPAIEPHDFDLCPTLLVHPAVDKWVTVDLSRITQDKFKSESKVVMLENAGHWPIEQPGLQQMEDAIVEFIEGILNK